MKNHRQFQATKSSRGSADVYFSTATSRFCFIFVLLANVLLCNPATALQITVGSTDSSRKVWNSISHPALATEAMLRSSAPRTLLEENVFSDAVEALENMGLDIDLTTSATDDSLTMDETWQRRGASEETGELLRRYLRSRNAVYEVTKAGAIKIISMDEMNDEGYSQTIVYRVNHLAADYQELVLLKKQIQHAFQSEQWSDYSGGSASISPRIQSGHRLLLVSTHYHYHTQLRQLLHELSVATAGLPNLRTPPAPSRILPNHSAALYSPPPSQPVGQHSSRLIALPTSP